MSPAREKPWGLAAAGSSSGSPSSSGPFLPEQARRHRRRPRGSRDGCRGTCSIKRAEAVEEGAESSASREGRRTGTGRGAEEGPGRRQARKPSTTQKHGGGLETRTVLGLTNGDPKVVPPTVCHHDPCYPHRPRRRIESSSLLVPVGFE